MSSAEFFTGGEVHLGDAMDVLPSVRSSSVDMVYIDPPFFTQRKWTGTAGSFDDRWDSREHFVEYMRARVVELRRVLKNRGALYFHADPAHASHELKIMLDGVFGPKSFMAEIVWKRSAGRRSNRVNGFPHAYDVILAYEKKPGAHHLREARESLILDLTLGATAKERVGYPTQKPVALLEYIIAASTDPGGVVLDCFCGSGTTLVAAQNLGRRFVGIDQSTDAVATAAKRLSQGTLL